MNDEQVAEVLKGLSDADLLKIFESLWPEYPRLLLRDELVLRLKTRTDISVEAKRIRYKEIIDRHRFLEQWRERWLENMGKDEIRPDAGFIAWAEGLPERIKTKFDEDLEHFRQLAEYHSKLPDTFEGKTKPGDWRPDAAQICPVCAGKGRGHQNRTCAKCMGRGYLKD